MSMLFKFEGGQAQMFTMLFSNFPETIKKEVKDILTGLLQEHMAKFFKRDQNVFENFLEEQSGRHR